jgi:hypothetical protein
LKKEKSENWKKYLKESTVFLLQRIVCDSDRLALDVLLETRKLYHTREKSGLSIIQYMIGLRDKLMPPQECNNNFLEIADCAYDLTLAKYSNLPNSSPKAPKANTYRQKGDSVDCRLYYFAVLNQIQERIFNVKPKGPLEEEKITGSVFQGLVTKNFFRSRLECARSSKFTIRYVWNACGKKFSLKYPSHMTAKQFREWLSQNTQHINLMKPDAQIELQSLINEKLKAGYHIEIDNLNDFDVSEQRNEPLSNDVKDSNKFTKDLSNSVTRRKVRNLNKQRPAIRKLGKKKLENLIKEIFEQLDEDEFTPGRMAKKYGISKSTFSRFAGSKWNEIDQNIEVASIPDLWQNTAKVLAGNPILMETVIAAGFTEVLKNIFSILEPSPQKGLKNAT